MSGQVAVSTYICQQRGTNNHAVRMSGLSDEVARIYGLWLSHVFADFAKGGGLLGGLLGVGHCCFANIVR